MIIHQPSGPLTLPSPAEAMPIMTADLGPGAFPHLWNDPPSPPPQLARSSSSRSETPSVENVQTERWWRAGANA